MFEYKRTFTAVIDGHDWFGIDDLLSFFMPTGILKEDGPGLEAARVISLKSHTFSVTFKKEKNQDLSELAKKFQEKHQYEQFYQYKGTKTSVKAYIKPLPSKIYTLYPIPAEWNDDIIKNHISDQKWGELVKVVYGHYRAFPAIRNEYLHLHLRKVCPDNVGDSLRLRGINIQIKKPGQQFSQLCRYCKQTGHIAKDCPKKTQCSKCGKRGHSATLCHSHGNVCEKKTAPIVETTAHLTGIQKPHQAKNQNSKETESGITSNPWKSSTPNSKQITNKNLTQSETTLRNSPKNKRSQRKMTPRKLNLKQNQIEIIDLNTTSKITESSVSDAKNSRTFRSVLKPFVPGSIANNNSSSSSKHQCDEVASTADVHVSGEGEEGEEKKYSVNEEAQEHSVLVSSTPSTKAPPNQEEKNASVPQNTIPKGSEQGKIRSIFSPARSNSPSPERQCLVAWQRGTEGVFTIEQKGFVKSQEPKVRNPTRDLQTRSNLSYRKKKKVIKWKQPTRGRRTDGNQSSPPPFRREERRESYSKAPSRLESTDSEFSESDQEDSVTLTPEEKKRRKEH